MKNKNKLNKIFWLILFVGLFFAAFTKSAAAANDCACGERGAFDAYNIKSIIASGSNGACMNTCRSNGNDFYVYPNVSSLAIGSWTW